MENDMNMMPPPDMGMMPPSYMSMMPPPDMSMMPPPDMGMMPPSDMGMMPPPDMSMMPPPDMSMMPPPDMNMMPPDVSIIPQKVDPPLEQKNQNELENLLEQMQKQNESERETPPVSKSVEEQPIIIQHEQLMPILNAKAIQHENKLQVLEEKKAVLSDKITHNQEKIANLTARAEKLEDVNQLFKAFSSVPFIKSIMESNEKKIESIRKEKIPKHKHKINIHQKKLGKFSEKQVTINHKLQRCRALNKVIQSFSIANSAERRKTFSDGLAELKTSTKNCLTDKVNQMQSKKNGLMQKYESVSSAAEKFQIQQRINALSEKISEAEKKIGKIQNQTFENTSALDNVIKTAEKVLDAELKQTAAINVPALAETICQDNTQSQTLQKTSSVKKEYTIAVVTDEQIEHLKNNHFPFAARKTKNEDGTTAIRFEKNKKAAFEQLTAVLQQKKPKLSL